MQTHTKSILWAKSTALHATMPKYASYPIAVITFFVEELRMKLDHLCFTYQHVDCPYKLFKYWFNGNIIVRSGQVFDFDNVQRAVCFNQWNSGVDRMSSIAKKRLPRKKYRKHILSTFQNKKSKQTSGSVFAERIEQIEKKNMSRK